MASFRELLAQTKKQIREVDTATADELRATAGIESGLANLARRRVTDKNITAQILSGDTEAFKRRLAAEEEDQ